MRRRDLKCICLTRNLHLKSRTEPENSIVRRQTAQFLKGTKALDRYFMEDV
jgi:hypothetical protein